jgi:ribosome-binding factor A
MGRDRTQISEELRRRISERVRDIGLEVICVAVTNVHPEMSVAQSYREVIGAEQQKVAAIREARVTEEQRLSAAAGDARRARAIAKATVRAREATERANTASQALRAADEAIVGPLATRLAESAALFHDQIAAAARLDDAREVREQVDEDYALGLGQTAGAQERAAQAVRAAETQYQAADGALEGVLAPFRTDAARRLNATQVDGLIESVAARVAGAYWEEDLDREFNPAQLGGEAAARLSGALADRWQTEMGAAAELVRVQNEREAYRAAPEIYKSRRLMEVLVDGVKDARKYFLAFDPGKRTVRVRFVAEDQAGSEPIEWRTEEKRP